MKFLLAFTFAAVTVALASPNAQDAKLPGCYWEGTAPICKGQCKSGWKEIVRTKCGDGNTCLSGDKAYCCPEGTVV
jgi:hypothetical protein